MKFRNPSCNESKSSSATVRARQGIIGKLGQGLWTVWFSGLLSFLAVPFWPGQFAPGQEEFSAADLDFFESKIRPLLLEKCWECHGSDEVEGDLQLNSRKAILEGGGTGPAAEPGTPEKSLMIQAINYAGEYEMPPDSKLRPEEIELLTEWVRRGLPWPNEKEQAQRKPSGEFDLASRRAEHWCWQPVRSHPPPEVQQTDWPRDPLDQFILAKLESQGLRPAADADRAVWLRRVYLDLTGLLPSPDELENFLSDRSPQANDRVVDYLLSSPRFGERWARHWMDLVRYAESYGHEFDYPIPQAFEYRDYLIRSFNSDLPYDQFIREQIAGDLLVAPRLNPDEKFNESLIGTGFWCFGEATHAPVDVRGDQAIRVENQIDVMSKSFLALTIGCARCHEHKFDAISTEDYYALAGFMNSSSVEKGMLDPNERIKNAAEESLRRRRVVESLLDAERPRDWLFGTDPNHLLDAIHFLRSTPCPTSAEEVKAWNSKRDDFARERNLLLGEFGLLLDHIVAAHDWSHPLFAVKRLAETVNQDPEIALNKLREELESWRANAAQSNAQSTKLFDFDELSGTTFQSGFAFGNMPISSGDGRENREADISTAASKLESGPAGEFAEVPRHPQVTEALDLLPANSISSRAIGAPFQGVLRSKTFTIDQPQLHFLYRGNGCQIRLVMDGYFMDAYNGLLFAGFKMDLPPREEFGWVTQAGDIKNYLGHRAHLEWIDHGNGYLDIAEVRSSAGWQPISPVDPANIAALDPSNTNLEHFCFAFTRHESNLLRLSAGEWTDSLELIELALQRTWLRFDEEATESGQVSLRPDVPEGASLAEEFHGAVARWRDVLREVPAPRYCIAMADCSGENEFVFARGNPKVLGPQIGRRNITALSSERSVDYEAILGSGRLELANEIASPENPLTSRVAVNRLWHYLFGQGIVSSVDNFGVLGELPSHPELLDHLAAEFVRDGWSVKRFLRRVCLSRTYELSSVARDESLRLDPSNKFLHAHPLKRMEGEMIRDNVLQLSGELNLKMYGPSEPVHLTEFMQGRGRPGHSGSLDGGGRRSVYQEIRRNFLSPMMLAFDTPAPFSTVGKRNVSNVPAQALIMLNDPFVTDQARKWGARIAKSPLSEEQKIESMFLAGISRTPSDEELKQCLNFIDEQIRSSSADEAWGALGHIIFNMKEFLFVY